MHIVVADILNSQYITLSLILLRQIRLACGWRDVVSVLSSKNFICKIFNFTSYMSSCAFNIYSTLQNSGCFICEFVKRATFRISFLKNFHFKTTWFLI